MRVILLSVFLLAFPGYAFSQAGTLDSTFDGDGIVLTHVGVDAYGYDLAIQPDGRILMAGYSGPLGFEDFVLARYNEDGSQDLSFGNNGTVITNISNNDKGDYCYSLALQPDGKIVIGGISNISNDFNTCLLRFNSDGTPDISFDDDGIVTTIDHSNAQALAIQPDGKILVTGDGLTTARYNADGSVDSSWGTIGVVYTDPAGHGGASNDIGVQPDGKIVIAGFAYDTIISTGWDILIVRYNPDGTMDNSFDNDGLVFTSLSEKWDAAFGIVIQPDGKIVVTGFTEKPDETYDFATLRYNTDGKLDSTWSDDGIDITSVVTKSDNAYDVLLQPDGKIIVAGSAFIGTASDNFGIIRFNADGSKDSSFNSDGIIITDLNHDYNDVCAIALQADGKLVVGGTYYDYPSYGNDQFILARYSGDCIQVISQFTYLSINDTVAFTSAALYEDFLLWDFGDGNFSSDPNPFHTYVLPGIYEVCLIAGNNCSYDTLCETITIIATSLNQSEPVNSHWTVFPNPFSSETIIRFSLSKNSDVQIEMSDLQGKKIKTITERNFSEGNHQLLLQKENLQTGAYFLKLTSDSGVYILKLIVE